MCIRDSESECNKNIKVRRERRFQNQVNDLMVVNESCREHTFCIGNVPETPRYEEMENPTYCNDKFRISRLNREITKLRQQSNEGLILSPDNRIKGVSSAMFELHPDTKVIVTTKGLDDW